MHEVFESGGASSHRPSELGRGLLLFQKGTLGLAGVFHDRRDLVVDLKFAVGPFDKGADRADADAEITGDLLVGMAAGEGLEHIAFTRGKRDRGFHGDYLKSPV